MRLDFKNVAHGGFVPGIFGTPVTVCICYMQSISYTLKLKTYGECCCEFLSTLKTCYYSLEISLQELSQASSLKLCYQEISFIERFWRLSTSFSKSYFGSSLIAFLKLWSLSSTFLWFSSISKQILKRIIAFLKKWYRPFSKTHFSRLLRL